MPSKTAVTIGTLIGVLLPISAGAYTPPNEVLTNENVYEGFILPPNKRSVQQRVEEQRIASETRRNQEQAGIFEEDEEPVDDEEEPAVAASSGSDSRLEEILSSIEKSLSAKGEQDAAVSRERQRLMDRIAIQELERELLRGAAPEIYAGDTMVTLRPGAPLQPTGPASMAAGACLAAAGLWTVLRAGRMQTKKNL